MLVAHAKSPFVAGGFPSARREAAQPDPREIRSYRATIDPYSSQTAALVSRSSRSHFLEQLADRSRSCSTPLQRAPREQPAPREVERRPRTTPRVTCATTPDSAQLRAAATNTKDAMSVRAHIGPQRLFLFGERHDRREVGHVTGAEQAHRMGGEKLIDDTIAAVSTSPRRSSWSARSATTLSFDDATQPRHVIGDLRGSGMVVACGLIPTIVPPEPRQRPNKEWSVVEVRNAIGTCCVQRWLTRAWGRA